MKNYLRNWNFMRIIRLLLGVVIIVQGFQSNDWIFVGLGALFTLMPLLNIGCCGTSACNIPNPKNKNKAEDVIYQEVK